MAILVGKNNAGKSTIIEALRILSLCQSKSVSAKYSMTPIWLQHKSSGAGFLFRIDTIDIDLRTIHRNYEIDDIAKITAKLSNNITIEVFIGRDEYELFCKITNKRITINSQLQAKKANLGSIRVMPPVGRLIENEKPIKSDYLKKNADGRLAYRHFRNQLAATPADFEAFRQRVADTWQGVLLSQLESNADGAFELMVREGPHSSEAAWVGSGLQAWLQTIWFISRVPLGSIVVLDEPDVYLHSDVQRKLMKLLTNLDLRQVIVATHSADIISDVPANYVVVVNKREAHSKSLSSIPSLQHALADLGSSHNIQLSKLGSTGIVLFVEGNDASLLSDVVAKLGSRELEKFSNIPIFSLGGKSNWQRALGAAQAFSETSEGQLRTMALLDGDFMNVDERSLMMEKAKGSKLELHIWKNYEIENYFLNPDAISDYINRANQCILSTPSDIERIIDDCAIGNKHQTILGISDQRQSKAIRHPSSLYVLAEKEYEEMLSKGKKDVNTASGKRIFSLLSASCREKYGVSFGAQSISKRMKLSQVPDELLDFVRLIIK